MSTQFIRKLRRDEAVLFCLLLLAIIVGEVGCYVQVLLVASILEGLSFGCVAAGFGWTVLSVSTVSLVARFI